jgi:hypothetical protein
MAVKWLVTVTVSADIRAAYSLDNFFIVSGITQAVCVVLMIAVSLCTSPKPEEQIARLLVSRETIALPANEPHRPAWQSFRLWWILFALFYIALYIYLW